LWFFAEINTIEYIYQRTNMAQASSVISPGYTLIGSTPAPGSAPVSYQIQTPEGTVNAGDTSFTLIKPNDRTTIVRFSSGAEVVLSNQQLDSFTAGLNNAWDAVNRSLRSQATTTNTTSAETTTSTTTPRTTPETTTNTTSTAETTSTTPPRTSPETTTNPSNAALPLGDDIDDIYDPNLTPEQIASLSPGDRQARDEFLADSETNADTAQDEIIVTGTTEDDEIVVNGGIDWRVRLSLAQDSTYFYNNPDAGILKPLIRTNGVIFPYTPAININYLANYEPASIVHSNYKVFQYSNSSVDSVTITCDFTAQDDGEANYMLAVIHFFRSLTKMFFGQDQQPRAGTPPPLCYLTGIGTYQFSAHALAVSSFAYNLPNDVDYISTDGPITMQAPTATNNLSSSLRLPPNVVAGGVAAPPMFEDRPRADSRTWVPTKMQMVITCIPIVSRNEVSNEFSLREYSNGSLIDRGFW